MKEITYKVKVDAAGDKRWYVNNKCHREDGPAVEWANGNKYWYVNGKRHREDGPACEYVNGDKFWYVNGKLHRENGPACEYADGSKFWYVNGVQLSEKEFNKRNKKTSCAGKVINIDRKNYKLVEV